jgi:hypothetical protein
MTSLDEEWEAFLTGHKPTYMSDSPDVAGVSSTTKVPETTDLNKSGFDPSTLSDFSEIVCEDLYISTKTKVLYLSHPINTHALFWAIPVVDYWRPMEGVIKKQMKIVSNTPEEFEELQTRINGIDHYHTEHVIKNINNPTARKLKFKDDRKLTIGLSKKDIMNCRGKIKKAFMNCFAMIIRFFYEGNFREIHVKVFNTGKLEIPGVLNNTILDIIRRKVIMALQPFVSDPLSFIDNFDTENVLINSNFKCGFCINREKLCTILGKKYGIEVSYDACNYPGIKCKYYYNNELSHDDPEQNGTIHPVDRALKLSELELNRKYTEMSFMIFRTGSCMIVGNCSDDILMHIFEFIKRMLKAEYTSVAVNNEAPVIKSKQVKLRKKLVNVSSEYYTTQVNP